MNFFEQTGKMAIGSRLRLLSEKTMEDAKQILKLYEVELKPKWFPVFFVLSKSEFETVTSIAEKIKHSHPSVSKILREMKLKGLIEETKDVEDKRKTFIKLSDKGIQIIDKIEDQYIDLNATVDGILEQTHHNLWLAIEEWETILSEKSLIERVKEVKKQRESKEVVVVDYVPEYKEVFRALNEEWVTTYFKMEDMDYKTLYNPEEYVLKPGGHILVALYKGEPLGVCALAKVVEGKYDFELIKMAVSPKVRGKNIGYLLGKKAIEKAKEKGAESIFLESNTILKPAISLYKKLGFKQIIGFKSPYERANIQMELKF